MSIPIPSGELPAPSSPGEALFRFEHRARPFVWHDWRDTPDEFRIFYEVEASKIALVARPSLIITGAR